MVKFQFSSDIHLEQRQEPIDYYQILQPQDADVLGLLGDIGSPYDHDKLQQFLQWCSDHWKIVLYVPGNHEYYSHIGDTYTVLHEELTKICSLFPNVKLLHNDTYTIDDVIFIGSTLWTYIPPVHDISIKNYFDDFRVIYAEPNRVITPNDFRAEFQKNVTYIKHQINVTKQQRNKKIVILTHHVPSLYQTCTAEYEQNEGKYGFATQISYQDNPNLITLWCSGHTHNNYHHTREGYELRSNQIGCNEGGPLPGYDPTLIITI